MRLIKCEKDVMNHYYKRTKNQKILEEFMNSGLDIAEVVEYDNKNASQCASSLNNSIKRYRFNSIKAFSKNNRAFLMKLSMKTK